MIRIKDAEIPDYLSSPKVEASKVDIRNQVAAGVPKLTIPSHWGDPVDDNKIKHVLFGIHAGKCCYCERARTQKTERWM